MKTITKIPALFIGLLILISTALGQPGTENDTAVLSLRKAISVALENNHEIIIAKNDAEMNENKATPGYAGLYPSLDVQGNYTEELNNTDIQFASPEQPPINRDNARSTTYNASINFNYNIFGGLGKYYRYESLKNLDHIGNVQLRMTIENTLIQVYQFYLEVVRLAENVAINEQTLEISTERYNRMNKQYEYGGTGKLQVLNAQVDLNTDSINVETAKNDLANAKRNLNILMGRDPGISFKVQSHLPMPEAVPDVQKLIDSAMRKNNQVLLARYRRENAALQYKIAKAGYYPRLDLTSSYRYNNVDNEAGFITQQETYGLTGGVSLRFNIFNGRQQAIDVQNAEITIDNRMVNLENVKKQIKRDILNYYHTYKNNLLMLNMVEDDVETAMLNFQRSEELLNTGQINSTDFRTAQLNLNRARLTEIQYQIQAKLSEIQLKNVAGLLIKE